MRKVNVKEKGDSLLHLCSRRQKNADEFSHASSPRTSWTSVGRRKMKTGEADTVVFLRSSRVTAAFSLIARVLCAHSGEAWRVCKQVEASLLNF